jgi:hypothetical protein
MKSDTLPYSVGWDLVVSQRVSSYAQGVVFFLIGSALAEACGVATRHMIRYERVQESSSWSTRTLPGYSGIIFVRTCVQNGLLGNIAKVPKGSLKSINNGIFPCFLKSFPFIHTICHMPITDVLRHISFRL